MSPVRPLFSASVTAVTHSCTSPIGHFQHSFNVCFECRSISFFLIHCFVSRSKNSVIGSHFMHMSSPTVKVLVFWNRPTLRVIVVLPIPWYAVVSHVTQLFEVVDS